MIRIGMTRLEAAREWVKGFNAIPTRMIIKLMGIEPDDWSEVTRPAVGDRVEAFDSGVDKGSLAEIDYETGWCKVKLDTGGIARYHENRIDVEYDDGIPMWGTMWSFHDSADNGWFEFEYDEAIKAMSDCGFRVYESDDYGYFFGIDGYGYDFYEHHWVPL